MNYLREINAFYDWLETNSIPDSAIVLWHALMHTCNKAGWVMEFAVAISTLEAKTGLKKGAIIRARQRLQQMGRIDFKSRSGQQSAIYTITAFDSVSVPKENTNWNTNRTQSGTQTGRKVELLNKLNKTKLNNDYIIFCEWFNQIFGRQYKPATYKEKICARLKNYSIDQLKTASLNMKANAYMMGDNDCKKVYADLEYITRNDKNVDKWLVSGQPIVPPPPPNSKKAQLVKRLYLS